MKKGKIQITWGFVLLMSALYLLDDSGMLSALILSAIAHELGHMAAIGLCHGKILGLKMDVTGFKIAYDGMTLSYKQEVIIALAGPAASLALAYGASWFGNHYGVEYALLTAGISLILCVFNMLPIRQFDGGRAVFMLLSSLTHIDTAERVLCVLSCVTIFAMLITGAYLFVASGWNFTWLTVSLWLLVGYCKNHENGIEC